MVHLRDPRHVIGHALDAISLSLTPALDDSDSDRSLSKQKSSTCKIIEGQFQAFQRFSSSKLVLKTVESCFVALNYGNGSR
jgi:hypothetical protein